MFASIRKYNGAPQLTDELVKHEKDTLNVLRPIKGFHAYYLVKTGEGAVSITVCNDKAGADESNCVSATWMKDKLPDVREPFAGDHHRRSADADRARAREGQRLTEASIGRKGARAPFQALPPGLPSARSSASCRPPAQRRDPGGQITGPPSADGSGPARALSTSVPGAALDPATTRSPPLAPGRRMARQPDTRLIPHRNRASRTG